MSSLLSQHALSRNGHAYAPDREAEATSKAKAEAGASLSKQQEAFAVACERGHADVVSSMLVAGTGCVGGLEVDPSCANSVGQTALHRACMKGDTAVVRVLVESERAGLDTQSATGWTPLHTAACFGHTHCAQLLISQLLRTRTMTRTSDTNNALNVADLDGDTALTLASLEGHSGILRSLLCAVPRGIDINGQNVDGNTALIQASKGGHARCARLLLAAQGICVRHSNAQGNTALIVASSNGHASVVRALVAADDTALHINHANASGVTASICFGILLLSTLDVSLRYI